MTRSLKKRPKGLVIEELTRLTELGQAMHDAPAHEMHQMAMLMVDRLEWTLAVLAVLPLMSKSIQVVADFNRAGGLGKQGYCETLEQERAAFQQSLRGQIHVLAKAVDRWSKSGTRPLS